MNSKLYFVGGLNVVHATLCAFPNIVFDIVNSQCIRCTLLGKAVHRPQISDSDSVHKEKCKLMGCAKEQCSEYNACSAVQCNVALVHTAQCKLSAKGQYCEAIARVQQLERPSLPFENADTMLHLRSGHI